MEWLDAEQSEIEIIYEQYFSDVYYFLLSFIGNKEDAQDLTQETFIKVLRNLSNYQGKSKLKTWILQIAKNCAIDFYRKRKKENTQLVPQVPEKFYSTVMEFEGVDNKYIFDLLNSLKPEYKAIIILRIINEFSLKETAEVLGISYTKAKVSYHRAIKKLGKNLKLEVNKNEFPR